MSATGVRSFGEVLGALMRRQGLTYRALAARTADQDAAGRGLTHSYLAGLVTRGPAPSPEATETIAAALEVPPESFLEYRLALVRRAFDERLVGPEQASANLDVLRQLVVGAPEAAPLAAAIRARQQAEAVEVLVSELEGEDEALSRSDWKAPRRRRPWKSPEG